MKDIIRMITTAKSMPPKVTIESAIRVVNCKKKDEKIAMLSSFFQLNYQERE